MITSSANPDQYNKGSLIIYCLILTTLKKLEDLFVEKLHPFPPKKMLENVTSPNRWNLVFSKLPIKHIFVCKILYSLFRKIT